MDSNTLHNEQNNRFDKATIILTLFVRKRCILELLDLRLATIMQGGTSLKRLLGESIEYT